MMMTMTMTTMAKAKAKAKETAPAPSSLPSRQPSPSQIRRARLLRRCALLFPFIIGPFAVRLAIGPVSHALASAAMTIAPTPPSASAALPLPLVDESDDEEKHAARPFPRAQMRSEGHSHSLSSSPPPIPTSNDAGVTDAGMKSPAVAFGPSHGTIHVPASVIAKAIEKKDVSASNAVGPDGRPLGAKIHGASKYGAGLRDGDIITFVAGTRTETTQVMVDVATRALASGATSLSGKILRGDETWDVVLDLPRRD
jgi:hypothetical protein